MNKKNKSEISTSLFWKILENGGSQGVQFIVSVLLARLLSPSEYGIVAIVLIFTTIANVLVQNGFASALIQKFHADDLDFSSVLIFNVLLSLAIYILLFLGSPVIAGIYKNPELIDILRVMGIIILPGSIISIENSYVARNMKFKTLFIATFLSSVISGSVSVIMALEGAKVWALVFQQIVYYFALLIILGIGIKYFPGLKFSLERLKTMFAYGSKLLAASLIDTIFTNIHGLVIGKAYSEDMLGSFNRGEQFPKLVVSNLSSAIQSVLLPAMSKKQESKEDVKALLKSSVRLSTFVVAPMMCGLAAVSDNLILLLLGEKWRIAIPFLQMMCFSYVFWPIHVSNLEALNAMGRSDIFLKLEIIKKILGIAILLIGIRYNVFVFVGLKAFSDLICAYINATPNGKLLGYTLKEQSMDALNNFIPAIIMGIIIYIAGKHIGIGILSLLIQVVLGVIIYIALAVVMKNENFKMIVSKVR